MMIKDQPPFCKGLLYQVRFKTSTFTHNAKRNLNKKSGAMHQNLISFNINAKGFRKTTNASRSAHGWQLVAGNFYFPHRRIFIFCFSEPFGINIEGYEGLVHCTRLFIQICWRAVLDLQMKLNMEQGFFFLFIWFYFAGLIQTFLQNVDLIYTGF